MSRENQRMSRGMAGCSTQACVQARVGRKGGLRAAARCGECGSKPAVDGVSL